VATGALRAPSPPLRPAEQGDDLDLVPLLQPAGGPLPPWQERRVDGHRHPLLLDPEQGHEGRRRKAVGELAHDAVHPQEHGPAWCSRPKTAVKHAPWRIIGRMAPADLSARPLGLAEVVDRSVALGLRHFRPLFLAMLLVQAPALLAARELSGATELFLAVADPTRAAEVMERVVASVLWIPAALLALQLLATGAAAAIVGESLDPRPHPVRPGRLRAAWAVLCTSALQMMVLALAPLVAAVPGVWLAERATSLPVLLAGVGAATLAAVVAFLFVTLRLVLAPVAAALEGRSGPGALLRSWRLMAPPTGARFLERPGVRASLVLLATFILALSVSGLAGLPRLFALRAMGGASGLSMLGAHLPLGLELALSLLEAVAGAAVQPFSLVAVAVLYADRRARAEGLDLEAWAERLEEAP
jgi:hypothetical protein